jgi:hypothetical protein
VTNLGTFSSARTIQIVYNVPDCDRSKRAMVWESYPVDCGPGLATIDGCISRFSARFPIIETIATGSGIREIARLRRLHGRARWRKRKGIARVRLSDGTIRTAELHWYEAAAIGRNEFKIKHLL